MEIMPVGCNCVRLLDKFEDANNAYLVLEYLEGTTLDGFLMSLVGQPPSEEDLQSIFKQVFEFIRTCHEIGAVFCDIKPSNFMVLKTEAGNLRVTAIDFGCAQLVNQPGTTLSQRTCTFKYFSPEVFGQNYSAATDIWSAGIMMYRVMAKTYPWWGLKDAVTAKDVQSFVCSKEITPFRDEEWAAWSVEARELVKLLLIKDASLRCTADEALQLLHRWIAKNKKDLGKIGNNIVPVMLINHKQVKAPPSAIITNVMPR